MVINDNQFIVYWNENLINSLFNLNSCVNKQLVNVDVRVKEILNAFNFRNRQSMWMTYDYYLLVLWKGYHPNLKSKFISINSSFHLTLEHVRKIEQPQCIPNMIMYCHKLCLFQVYPGWYDSNKFINLSSEWWYDCSLFFGQDRFVRLLKLRLLLILIWIRI